jgi:uncharacterized protein YjdB
MLLISRRLPRLALLATLMLACGGGEPSASVIIPPPVRVARVELSPNAISLDVQQTVQLTARALDAQGNTLSGRTIAFSSADPTIASIDATSGLVTAIAAGSTTISATSENVTATASVLVNALPAIVDRVTLTPGSTTINVGATTPLVARALDARGNEIMGRPFTFSSSNTSVASVNGSGVVTGVAAGTAMISATSDGRTGTAMVTVNGVGGAIARIDLAPASASVPIGLTTQLTATAFDAANQPVSATFTYSTNAVAIASVSQTGLVTGIAVGAATITASAGGKTSTSQVTVMPLPSGNVIDVVPSTTYQTMIGWQGASQIGQDECNATAYPLYKTDLLDRLTGELGINRVTMGLYGGFESRTNYYQQWTARQITTTEYFRAVQQPENDNADPFSADPSGFQWSHLDNTVDEVVNPIRQRLAARGEKLYVTLTYVDSRAGLTSKPFLQMKAPEEYAELVTQAFLHLQQKYGWVPDALELILEPENSFINNGLDIGRSMVATGDRLKTAGFSPNFIAPSSTGMRSAVSFYDQVTSIPRALQYLTDYAYHRYTIGDDSDLAQIAARGQRDRVRTMMLEFNRATYDDLHKDLTIGNNSTWMQFALAFCPAPSNANASNTGAYYTIIQSNPSNPQLIFNNQAKFFRQYFLFVRQGAVRIGATSGNQPVIDPVAFQNVNGKQVVVVKATSAAGFMVRGLAAGTYGIKYTTDAQYNIDLADVSIGTGGNVSTSIPAKGVITIYAR